MSDSNPSNLDNTLPPAQLWLRVKAQAEYALQCGALQSIPTNSEFIEECGVRFIVRILSNLARKDRAKKKQAKSAGDGTPFNPFLPYDPDLFVGNLSPTHLCLLNKYNVVDYHLLMVTRGFESQDSWLNEGDFDAAWRCLSEIDGLAFYNGGTLAGASQRHKHLQLIPMAIDEIPIDAVLQFERLGKPHSLPTLPFRHSAMAFSLDAAPVPHLLQVYRRLLQAAGIEVKGDQQTDAYNLLFTRRWMLVVPRSQESFESISVNSLGFAGSLFVRDEAQLKRLKARGPMAVLKEVAISH
ncbi:MAG: hypothetical protein WBA10_20540 [Elainellaceae cyanobacterium]